MARSVLDNSKVNVAKKILTNEDLNKIQFLNDSRSIGDQVALAISNLGENMSIRRAVIFTLQPGQYLGWYMHGSGKQL